MTDTFYVVLLGGRYIRFVEPPVATRQFEQALRFNTKNMARAAKRRWGGLETGARKLRILKVVMEEVR